jgi:hypothetical protein
MAVKRLLNIRPQYDDGNGALASGYRLFFYAAGSSTKQNTYNSSAGSQANNNPIVLNALGEPAVEIWGTVGQTYKIGLAIAGTDDPPASFIWTEDNISPINDTTVSVDEWVSGPTPTFVSATSFTVVCDPSQALDSGLSAVSYGLVSATNPSIPWISVGADTVSTVASAATVNLDNDGKEYQKVSGTTSITAITLAQSKQCTVQFTGALTLTNGASLILPGAANITTAAGDVAIFRGEAAGVVRCVSFMRAASPTQEQPMATVASAGTVNLETAGAQYVQITGTTTITAITLNNGAVRFVEFSGALTLTNGASLLLPGGGNINTVAGATAVFVGESGGVVRCLNYFASGTFTASLTGCTAGVTSTASWSQTGNEVTVNYQPMTGTSNTAACTVTGQPNPLKPVTAHNGFPIIIQDNSSAALFGRADVNTDGTLTLFVNASSAVFTAANVKGLIAGCTLTYNIN